MGPVVFLFSCVLVFRPHPHSAIPSVCFLFFGDVFSSSIMYG
jgi:hypothetical protein